MRLCMVQILDLPEEFLDPMFGMMKSSFDKVLRPDTEVVLKPAKGGHPPDHLEDLDNPYFDLLNKRPVIEALLEAEKEGFDGAWVNCFGDPGIKEARSVVGIPVFGACESTLHFACQIGRKFAVITANMPGQVALMEDQVRQHGLQDRLITNGVRTDKTPFEEAMTKGMQDPKLIAVSIEEVARGCVADGADVVIIGCCGLGPLCTLAGFNKITVGGGQEVPVLNAVTIVAKTTEMAVDIKKGTGLPIPSRIRGQALPSKGDLARVRTVYGLSA